MSADDGVSRIFKEIRPACVGLSQLTMSPVDTSGSNELLSALRNLDQTMVHSIGNRVNLPTNLADYIFVPVAELLKKPKITDSELEPTLHIIDALIVHFWSAPGALPKQLFTQLVPLITFLIGGPPDQPPQIGQHSDETMLNAVKAIRDLLEAGQMQDSTFLREIYGDLESVPSLGHTVTVLLDASLKSSSMEVQVSSLEALDKLYQSIGSGEILSLMLPGTVSSFAKLAKAHKTHYRVNAAMIQTLATMMSHVFDDFDLGTESNAPQEIDDVKDMDGCGRKVEIPCINETQVHRTNDWLEQTNKQLQKALKIILNWKDSQLEHKELRDSAFHLVSTLLRNCFLSCQPLVPQLLSTLAAINTSDPSYGDLLVDMLTFSRNSAGVVSAMNGLFEDETGSLAFNLSSPDSSRAISSLKTISFLVNALQKFNAMDRHSTSKLLDSLQGELSRLVQNTNASETRKRKMVTSTAAESYGSSIALITNNYADDRLDTDLKEEALFKGILDEGIENELCNLLKSMPQDAQTSVTSLLEDTDSLKNINSVIDRSVALWISNVISEGQPLENASASNQMGMDDFLDIGEPEQPKESLELVQRDNLYASLELANSIIDANAGADLDSMGVEKSTVLSLRTIGNACVKLGDEFRDELIDSLYPVVESLASSVEPIRNEAQITTMKIATTLYDGSVKQLIYDNRDYLIDALSMKLTGETLTPRLPVVLIILVRMGGSDILRQFGDIVTTIFTLLDLYHGYTALSEGFFSVFEEILDQLYNTYLKDFDFEEFATSCQEDDVLFNSPWGLQSSEDVEQFLKKETVDSLNGADSDDDDEDDIIEEEVKREKVLEIDSDDEDSDDETASIPTRYGDDNQHPSIPEDKDEWTSPLPKTTYTLVQDISSYAERLSKSPSQSMTLTSLRLLKKIVPILATQRSKFLPIAANLWQLTSSFIFASNDPRTQMEALQILDELIKFGGTFFSSRFISLFKEIDSNKRYQTFMKKQLSLQKKRREEPDNRVVFNPTSTSTNWEAMLFNAVCKFLQSSLLKLGRFVPLDVATSIVRYLIDWDDDESNYGYFDDLVFYTLTSSKS